MGWRQVPPDLSLCCFFLPGDKTSTTSTSSLAFPAHLPSPHLADAVRLAGPEPTCSDWVRPLASVAETYLRCLFFCQGSGHMGKLGLNQETVWGPWVTHLHPELQVGGL